MESHVGTVVGERFLSAGVSRRTATRILPHTYDARRGQKKAADWIVVVNPCGLHCRRCNRTHRRIGMVCKAFLSGWYRPERSEKPCEQDDDAEKLQQKAEVRCRNHRGMKTTDDSTSRPRALRETRSVDSSSHAGIPPGWRPLSRKFHWRNGVSLRDAMSNT